jgi:hypothetical protein
MESGTGANVSAAAVKGGTMSAINDSARRASLGAGLLATALALLSMGCAVETGTPDENVGQSEAALQSPFFLYFRCNATGWGVDDSTRMTETSLGFFEITYDVTDSWMVSDADTCIVTQTNQLNGWGTEQAFYGPARTNLIVVPGGDFLNQQQPGGDEHFKVKYPALGDFHAIANFLQGQVFIEPAP